jgi:sigma-B regulation protein RsbU (phosphoserine phosphatase)
LADEIIDHLVALLGVRTARLYLGPNPAELSCVARFGPQVLSDVELESAWESGVYRDEVVALPLKSTSGVLGLLVAANKEARAGTEPLADNDVRLLELFAIQVTVALEYARLTQESLERDRMRRELEVAAVIQGHLYPQEFPDFPGFRLAARSSSSRQVAGDTYDVMLRSGVLIVTITDVSGKGVGAGMIASGVQAGVRLLADADLPLEELALRINTYLEGATATNRFATFAMVRLWPDGRMSAVNAGHCPVLVRRRSGAIEQIISSGLPLGILTEARHTEETIYLEPGDLVVLYTDGLTEAEDPDEEEFGVERVADVVASVNDSDADSVCETLLGAVHAHACGRPLQDDATLLVVERLNGCVSDEGCV